MSRRTSVVVVDDSPFVCRLLAAYLGGEGDLDVVGAAHSGARALELVRERRPDVVTLDLEMPDMNGLETLRLLMRERPTAAVVVSGVSGRSATMTLQALDAGAVDFVLKYAPGAGLDPEELRREIVAKVRLAASVRVVRSLPVPARSWPTAIAGPATPRAVAAHDGLVVIGASTGGPLALRELLAELPKNLPCPVAIVQHIPASFTSVLAAQLDRHSALAVREAEDGERPEPGRVYVAPGGFHLLVGRDGRFEVSRGPEVGGHRPSIDVTMQSAAQVFGSRTVGVLLSGMGSDGVLGLRAIRTRGGRTLAQDAASCVVAGMSQRAIEAGLVDAVARPAELGRELAGAARPDRSAGPADGSAARAAQGAT